MLKDDCFVMVDLSAREEEKMKKEKIELILHHNYLSIKKEGIEEIQLPVRCAKIIKDMYNLRNAENEKKDLKHYSGEGFCNPIYEVHVFVMNAEFNSELQWISKTIEPLKIEGKKK